MFNIGLCVFFSSLETVFLDDGNIPIQNFFEIGWFLCVSARHSCAAGVGNTCPTEPVHRWGSREAFGWPAHVLLQPSMRHERRNCPHTHQEGTHAHTERERERDRQTDKEKRESVDKRTKRGYVRLVSDWPSVSG